MNTKVFLPFFSKKGVSSVGLVLFVVYVRKSTGYRIPEHKSEASERWDVVMSELGRGLPRCAEIKLSLQPRLSIASRCHCEERVFEATKQSPQPRSAREPREWSFPKSRGDCHVVPDGTPRNDNVGDVAQEDSGQGRVRGHFQFPRGLPRRPFGAPRNDSGRDVAQGNPGHGHPRNPKGIATSCLTALLAMTAGGT